MGRAPQAKLLRLLLGHLALVDDHCAAEHVVAHLATFVQEEGNEDRGPAEDTKKEEPCSFESTTNHAAENRWIAEVDGANGLQATSAFAEGRAT